MTDQHKLNNLVNGMAEGSVFGRSATKTSQGLHQNIPVNEYGRTFNNFNYELLGIQSKPQKNLVP